MIRSQYANRTEAAKAARLLWQLKTCEKTEAQLSDDEKKLLKIVV